MPNGVPTLGAPGQGTYPLMWIFTTSQTRDPRFPTWKDAGLSRSPRNCGVIQPMDSNSGITRSAAEGR